MPQCQCLPMGKLTLANPSKGGSRGERQGPSVSLPGLRPSSALCTGPRRPVQGRKQGTELQASEGACESCPPCFLHTGGDSSGP